VSRVCPSCRHTADDCSYPARPALAACWNKRRREEINATIGAMSIQYTRAKLKLRSLFPGAKRVEISPQRLEVEGLPLLPLPVLAGV
jgi:hypothetical protein